MTVNQSDCFYLPEVNVKVAPVLLLHVALEAITTAEY